MKRIDNMEKFIADRLRYWALPYFSTLVLGLAAHMFMLTNKVSFGGDVSGLFEKGATYISGRWGLEFIKWLMPDVSMPWFNGFFSLLLISAAVCVMLKIFDIRNRGVQVLLGGLIICSPAETATICYMFTCAPYALSMLMAVSAVYIFENCGRKIRWLASPLLLILSCSIYQGYFAFASSFCVIIMIKELLEKKDSREVFRHGFVMFVMLLVSVALYGATVPVMAKLAGLPVLDVINDEQSLLLRVAVTYSAYLKTYIKGYFGYVNNFVSMLMHLALVAFAAFLAARAQLKDRKLPAIALLAFLVFIFPMSCYCIYLLSDNGYIHSLALFPFCSVYFLMAVIFEKYIAEDQRLHRLAVSAALGIIVFSNILFANQYYFLCYLQFENKLELYSSMMAVVAQTEGFEEGVELAIVGEEPAMERQFEEYFNISGFQTPSFNITHVVHAEGFVKNFSGIDLPFADDEEIAALALSEEVQSMPVYPYYGSVKRVGDYMVVHFG